ncbi:Hypothetical protein A7982_08427 [Minicystis rosea]|nr:Hypothetical protein A7982_08427 [Minicystis rosea]
MSATVDLGALHARLEARGRKLDVLAARYIGHAVIVALAEAHAAVDAEGDPAPVIHGALRPEVVLIDRDGSVRLAFAPPASHQAWRAPEQRTGGRITPRVDVYAAGMMLRELEVGTTDALREAIAKATEPHADRRRITCFELSAWLARGLDAAAGKEAVAALVAASEHEHARDSASRPLSPVARLAVAGITAIVVFACGSLVMERTRTASGERARARPEAPRSDTLRP